MAEGGRDKRADAWDHAGLATDLEYYEAEFLAREMQAMREAKQAAERARAEREAA